MSEIPLSLYFQLEEGKSADIEVVSRATLAWAAAIKELSYITDPSLEVRIELVSGTEGSLSLNSIIRDVRSRVTNRQTLRTVVTTAGIWLALEIGSYSVGAILDYLRSTDASEITKELSNEEIESIAKEVATKLEQGVAHNEIYQFYGEVTRDPHIVGVGSTTITGNKPTIIIPRSEIEARINNESVTEESTTRRIKTEKLSLTLVKPTLIEGKARRWGFLGPFGEFGAVVKDTEFLSRVLTGTTHVPMVAGILMDVELETVEEFEQNVWRPKSYTITKVLALYPPTISTQSDLPLLDSGEDDDTSQD